MTMTQEQKAKAYDEAILKLRDMIPNWERLSYNGKTFLQDLIYIFPVLKKSDIKTGLIKYFRNYYEMYDKSCGEPKWGSENMLVKDILAWLEKQDEQNLAEYEEGLIDETKQSSPSLVMTESTRIGQIKVLKNLLSYLKYERKSTQEEIKLSFIPCIKNLLEEIEHKPADSVKPKYHEGEWVVFDCGEESKTLQIKEIIGKEYVFNDGTRLDIVDEDSLHLWTINDAKDGDVLCVYDCGKPNILFKFKGRAKKHNALIYYFYYNVEFPYINGTTGCFYPTIEDVRPATNGQRKLLIIQMHTAGYEWYGDLKELYKILTS